MSDRNAGYLIESIGGSAFGFSWPVDLADRLEVTATTLRHWRTGHSRVPPGAWVDMLRLLRVRRSEIDQAERELLAELPRIAPDLVAQIEAASEEQEHD